MNIGAVVLILSGITILVFPDILAYILGGLLLVSGTLLLVASLSQKGGAGKDHFKFGEYKIFKNDK